MLLSISWTSLILCGYFVNCYKIVRTDNGKVQGHIVTYDDIKILRFLGIPYAAAMTGKNRFKAPLPAEPWPGILLADKKVICTQHNDGEKFIRGVVDCLVVNIFTPMNINETLLPVVVTVHGGGFFQGYGDHNGAKNFVKRGIIVVTFNFRLGAEGFLCLRNVDAPGNGGQRDQVAALQWVQRNIANFGGDPKQVTLFGESSGAVSAHLLVLSKMTKGLFHRAVLNGASALSFWGLDYDPITTAKYILNFTFLELQNDKDLLINYYRSVSAEDLSEKSRQFHKTFFPKYGKMGFVPCVERLLNGTEAFLSIHPYNILNKKIYNKVPMILSFSPFEVINFLDRIPEPYSNFKDFLPLDLNFNSNSSKEHTAEILKRAYVNNQTNNHLGYVNYFSDSLCIYSILEAARLHSKYASVYLFEFAVETPMGFSYKGKAAHGALFDHIFPTQDIPSIPKVELAVERASTLMENFIKFGNPTPIKTTLLPVRWRPLRFGDPMTYLYQDWNMTVLTNPYPKRMMLWKKIYSRFHRRQACC